MRRCSSWVLLLLVTGVAGCGASGASTKPTTSTQSRPKTTAETALRSNGGKDLAGFPKTPTPATAQLPPPPRPAHLERTYLEAVFDDAQSVWRREFEAAHVNYTGARLVLFWG